MRLGDTVGESGAPMRHVYFPTTAIVSLLYVTGGWCIGRGRRGRQ